MIRKAAKFLQLSFIDQLLLFEALASLFVVCIMLRCLQFRQLAAMFGSLGVESSAIVPVSHNEIARRTGWAVETMVRHTPWESRCLAQALSAWWMLNRRGIAGTIYFGVSQAESGKSFNAHAWLRCGSQVVTGGANHEKFNVLSFFSKGTS